MPYKHIVSFKYKDTTSESTRSDVYARFNGLKQKCVLQDGSSYIVDLESGKANISPEGMGKGLDHLFIVTFDNPTHVKYYLEEDPVHLEFAKWVGGLVSDAFIYDFET